MVALLFKVAVPFVAILGIVAGCSPAGSSSTSETVINEPARVTPAGRSEPIKELPSFIEKKAPAEEKTYETSIDQPKDREGFHTVTVSVRSALRSDVSTGSEPILLLEKGTRLLAGHREDPEWLEVPLKGEKWGFIKRNQVKGMPAYPIGEEMEPIVNKPATTSPKSSDDDAAPRHRPERPQAYAGGSSTYLGIDDKHWIESVSDDGGIIKLEDGSTWKVDYIDRIDSSLWLPTTDIIVKESTRSIGGYILINIDDRETVGATFLGDD